MEYDLWLRLAERHVVWALDEVLATRRMSATNVAARAERAQIAEALAIRAAGAAPPAHAARRARARAPAPSPT